MGFFAKQSVLILFSLMHFALEARQCPDYSDTPTAELLGYLDDRDERTRSTAAYFLGFRYQQPQALNVRPPFYDPKKIAPVTVQVPTNVVPKLFATIQKDSELSVRLAALTALENMSFRTNAIPLVTQCLTNSMRLVRLRSCEILIKYCDTRGEQWPSIIITTLADCLSPTGSPDELYLAVYSVGCLETKGKPLIPFLEKLRTHPSNRIRISAIEALGKITKSL